MGIEVKQPEKVFTSYQVFVIAILSLLQFTVILDFMVLSPLGAILMEKLSVTTSQFGLVVSAYDLQINLTGKNYSCSSIPVLLSEPSYVPLHRVINYYLGQEL
jgi:hypothetical protein